ncbi:alpha/beta hydrolase [Novipirellula artificiosorum]|uniref:Alpha/beta hydrolase family protein n=1 Tax=Novipirellula artificiosorum TaxID=2528016 RepID=A0A5C6E1Y7_9BACT|nr:alpha/beta hydrolase [Novipirellula artificiosorum]TWU41987.1 hypothetical protein Poly41_02830 [Novipirellula artificiosorum]
MSRSTYSRSLRRGEGRHVFGKTAAVLFLVFCGFAAAAQAEQLFQLRNGLTLRGSKAEIPALNANAFSAAGNAEMKSRPIWVINDGLTRIYLHGKGMSAADPVDVRDMEEPIMIWQPTPLGGNEIAVVGTILATSPFNEYGRRVMKVQSDDGPLTLIQGITEISGRYARVDSLKGEVSYIWDTRLATSSIDSNTLKAIFKRRLDWDNLDERLKVVRFFMAAERYGDAVDVLRELIDTFPETEHMNAQIVTLIEWQVSQLLAEAQRRAEAGQEPFALQILEKIPVNQVGGGTRLTIQDAIAKIRGAREQAESLSKQLQDQVTQLNQSETLQPIVAEIQAGLSAATLPRLSDYVRLGTSEVLPLENRVALAVSGWLLGSGSGEDNLSVAISLVKVRDLVAEYLACEVPDRRDAILNELRNLEGAQPEYVDRILPRLLPPKDWPEGSADESVPGMYLIGNDQEQLDQPPTPRYVIQLPPDYNPLREYPCLVSLHPLRGNPVDEVTWWAGEYSESMNARFGHASRNGFIVVAPLWTRPGQRDFDYTPREHERVLVSLRHAMRRASIDSDRVFLAGRGEGGAAAWDIAYAHPDLWAGMISISGEPGKTITHYHPNAPYVPMYLVMGERDSKPTPLVRLGPIMDNYVGYRTDAMVVMYRGRGREFFYEEVPRMFEWMRLPAHRRAEMPVDIEAVTMRQSDNFFWWLEIGPFKPGISIDPQLWDQADRLLAVPVSASIGNGNQLRIIQVPSDYFTLWLRPMRDLDLTQPIKIRYRSRSIPFDFDGSLKVMLEDSRRRADRKRPFWAAVSFP